MGVHVTVAGDVEVRRQPRCTVMLSVSETDPDGELQVTAKVTVKLEPSNGEYVVAPRVQSGIPAVAASHWLITELSAFWNCVTLWNGMVPAA